MLKMIGVTLEKISDPDMYMFLEQGMRGEASYINKRYSEASRNVNIFSLDINNLYGCSMRQYCFVDKFYWVKNNHKIEQRLMYIKNNSSTGYVLEVDLEYPQELHDIHNDYPLARENITMSKRMVI